MKPKFSAHTHKHTHTLESTCSPLKKATNKRDTRSRPALSLRLPLSLSLPLLLLCSLSPTKHSASTAAFSSLTDETGSTKAATQRSSSSSEGVSVCVCVSLIVNKLFTHFIHCRRAAACFAFVFAFVF